MANLLTMAVVTTIYVLLEQGHSQRWIARTLGIDRETVGRYARLAGSKPAGAPPGSDADPSGQADEKKLPGLKDEAHDPPQMLVLRTLKSTSSPDAPPSTLPDRLRRLADRVSNLRAGKEFQVG